MEATLIKVVLDDVFWLNPDFQHAIDAEMVMQQAQLERP